MKENLALAIYNRHILHKLIIRFRLTKLSDTVNGDCLVECENDIKQFAREIFGYGVSHE